ncbi:MAG: OB-fold nucleic acid binding domain-containing protein [Halobacteriota archaeon]|nr:OB-fold nucleic acid binding domain-containing protein [Halobacteriota archaeon]
MEEIKRIYKELEEQISFDDFKAKIEEKIDLMGGLCDEKTAAMLLARDFGISLQDKIRDITTGKSDVCFVGKVIQADDPREFNRSDGSIGRVANLTISDETGSIRLVIWDEYTDLVKTRDIKVGTTLKVKGYVKEGYTGVEVNIGRNGSLEFTNEEIEVKRYKIGEISADMSAVNVIGKVIDSGEVRTFERKDGTAGKVKSLVIGDETGKMRVVLWGEQTNENFNVGEVIEVSNGYSKESYNNVEVHLGRGAAIRVTDEDVDYKEHITPIDGIGLDGVYNIMGNVTGIDTMREFVKKDGRAGRVANIYVNDKTGRIKVVLWDNHADLMGEVDIGSPVKITDGYVKVGFNDEIELNVGWNGKITLSNK